jgi:transcription elongation factor Elf1
MRKQKYTERRFKCITCNFLTVAYKKTSHQTKVGHLKDMYCPICKTDSKFIQLSKWD